MIPVLNVVVPYYSSFYCLTPEAIALWVSFCEVDDAAAQAHDWAAAIYKEGKPFPMDIVTACDSRASKAYDDFVTVAIHCPRI